MSETPRTKLAALIRSALPTKWPVRAYPEAPDAVASIAVCVYQTEVKPAEQAPVGTYSLGLTVAILASQDMPADKRENALEEALSRVLDVLDAAEWLIWSTAERESVEGFPAYRITSTATGKKSENA